MKMTVVIVSDLKSMVQSSTHRSPLSMYDQYHLPHFSLDLLGHRGFVVPTLDYMYAVEFSIDLTRLIYTTLYVTVSPYVDALSWKCRKFRCT